MAIIKRPAEQMSVRDFAAIQIMAAFATSDRREDVKPTNVDHLADLAVLWAAAIVSSISRYPEKTGMEAASGASARETGLKG